MMYLVAVAILFLGISIQCIYNLNSDFMQEFFFYRQYFQTQTLNIPRVSSGSHK